MPVTARTRFKLVSMGKACPQLLVLEKVKGGKSYSTQMTTNYFISHI